jgi:hypothetical protein
MSILNHREVAAVCRSRQPLVAKGQLWISFVTTPTRQVWSATIASFCALQGPVHIFGPIDPAEIDAGPAGNSRSIWDARRLWETSHSNAQFPSGLYSLLLKSIAAVLRFRPNDQRLIRATRSRRLSLEQRSATLRVPRADRDNYFAAVLMAARVSCCAGRSDVFQ